MSMNICQPSIRSVVIKSKLLMIETEKVKNRRMEIMDVDHISHRAVSELVGSTMGVGLLDSRTREPGGETTRIVVTPLRALLKRRHPAKFRGPEDEGLVKKPSGFHVLKQGGDGTIEDRAVAIIVRLDPPVTVPIQRTLAHRERTVEKCDKPDPTLHKPSCQQAIATKAGFDRIGIIRAVKRARREGLACEVARVGSAQSHPAQPARKRRFGRRVRCRRGSS